MWSSKVMLCALNLFACRFELSSSVLGVLSAPLCRGHRRPPVQCRGHHSLGKLEAQGAQLCQVGARLIISLIKSWVATKPVGVSVGPASGHQQKSSAGLCCRQPIAGAKWLRALGVTICVHIACPGLCHRLPGELVASRVGLV